MTPDTIARFRPAVLVTDLQSDEDGPYAKVADAHYPRWSGKRWLHSAFDENKDLWGLVR